MDSHEAAKKDDPQHLERGSNWSKKCALRALDIQLEKDGGGSTRKRAGWSQLEWSVAYALEATRHKSSQVTELQNDF